MKCLLIDDDLPTIEVMRDLINWETFGIDSVLTAHNIWDAQALFRADAPDIVICDIEMPRGSGMDMIQWVRDEKYDCAFLFFTCHESFDFASTAISYDADAYLIKPFNKSKIEAALAKTVNSLIKKNKLDEYRQFGEAWLKNKGFVEQSFWRDILFGAISPRQDLIDREIQKRDLALDSSEAFRQLLVAVPRTEVEGSWNEGLFKYAYSNLTSEIILDELDLSHIVSYEHDDRFYNAVILKGDIDPEEIKAKGRKLIRYCRDYFRCQATCYLSDSLPLDHMAQTKERMTELDRDNLIFRGEMHLERDNLEYAKGEPYTLDATLFEAWFVAGQKLQIVNKLKKELEMLASGSQLDADTLHAIHEDFMQIVYSVLYKNKIQAHKLFSDPVSRMMFQKSEHHVLDMMKWAAFITDKTIDYIQETKQSEGVVEKVKAFIEANYDQELSREMVASSVFLTPDYLAKMFKRETGLSIKDYLNDYRILKAKEALVQGNATISQIAADTGFESISYFSTVFKKITGETPVAFRGKHRGMHA